MVTVSMNEDVHEFTFFLLIFTAALEMNLITSVYVFMAKFLHEFAPRDGARGVHVMRAKEAC